MEDSKKQVNRITLHKFDSWSLELMNKPYRFDKWACGQVGENNEGEYREGYQKLPVEDNGEELVSCSDYGLVSKDYYLNVFLDEVEHKGNLLMPLLQNKKLFPFAWVRQTIAQRLRKADILLRSHDLFLVVNSGWRDVEVQGIIKELMSGEFGKDYVEKAIATAPKGGSSVTPHATGGACDLELWSLQTNNPLSYSYPGDVINSFVLEQKKDVDELEMTKKKIRRILFHVLTEPEFCYSDDEVFTVHPGEFWHFGDGDPLSAYLKRLEYAKYGYIRPTANYKFHGND